MLLQCSVINLYICLQTVVCRIMYGRQPNLGIRFVRFPQFNSYFDYAKYFSNMVARFYARSSDVILLHV